ncbi:hypothetical protein TNCV_1187231 [Trichonephila clavipes]|nr:hypothetical protein TNCV_1187231 [Trichonephila clavipes]
MSTKLAWGLTGTSASAPQSPRSRILSEPWLSWAVAPPSLVFVFSFLFAPFIYLFNARACLRGHLTPSLPVPTDDAVNRVFIESSA